VVLVDEAAENVSPTDLFGTSCRWVEERRVRGKPEIEPAMWSVGVVVLHVCVQHAIEMPTAQDERPVKELSSNRSHPSLSEGVGLVSSFSVPRVRIGDVGNIQCKVATLSCRRVRMTREIERSRARQADL
jgi:hypothetical protein